MGPAESHTTLSKYGGVLAVYISTVNVKNMTIHAVQNGSGLSNSFPKICDVVLMLCRQLVKQTEQLVTQGFSIFVQSLLKEIKLLELVRSYLGQVLQWRFEKENWTVERFSYIKKFHLGGWFYVKNVKK